MYRSAPLFWGEGGEVEERAIARSSTSSWGVTTACRQRTATGMIPKLDHNWR
ncbi:hypothetical protein [Halomicronema sp. CCY15110]|uniref:hypothetical protein n=1 Tax=Halomicronema sp. CCY15110 TaxID=2767773 RepID=UPI00194FBD7F|nr:hypothetical protein [Halomicronema sp. CCY15110]